LTDTTHVFRVDAEHGNLRLAVAVTFVLSSVICFFILAAVIPAEAVNLIAILGALVLGSLISAAAERALKRRWPSGREIAYQPEQLTLQQHGKPQTQIELNRETQLLQWRFEINKRARVPRGWLMVAMAVRYIPDDIYLPVYTLMSPEVFAAFDETNAFVELEKQKENDSGDLRLAGEQRRLHAAESYRWQEGVEMTNEDFEALYRLLRTQYNA